MATPGRLDFDSDGGVREAFDDGRLSLLVKEHPRYDSRAWGSHVRASAFISHGQPFATVHVMSKPAGGEIRGYVRLNVLHLRYPVMAWPELDEEVSRRLGLPVVASEEPS